MRVLVATSRTTDPIIDVKQERNGARGDRGARSKREARY